MKRFSFAVLFSAACLMAQGPRGGGHGFGPEFGMGPASRTPVTGAPYSAVQTTQTQQTLPDGNQITRQEQTKVYRDSSGRVRTEHTRTGAGGATTITIFDPVAGVSTMLNPTAATAVQMPLHLHNDTATAGAHAARAPREHSNARQAQAESLGTQMMNGVSATGKRTTATISAGAIGNAQPIQVVRETWVSADLKVPVMIKSTDPRFGTTTMQLTNISQVEPDPALFQVPANYQITTHQGWMGTAKGGHRQQQQ